MKLQLFLFISAIPIYLTTSILEIFNVINLSSDNKEKQECRVSMQNTIISCLLKIEQISILTLILYMNFKYSNRNRFTRREKFMLVFNSSNEHISKIENERQRKLAIEKEKRRLCAF